MKRWSLCPAACSARFVSVLTLIVEVINHFIERFSPSRKFESGICLLDNGAGSVERVGYNSRLRGRVVMNQTKRTLYPAVARISSEILPAGGGVDYDETKGNPKKKKGNPNTRGWQCSTKLLKFQNLRGSKARRWWEFFWSKIMDENTNFKNHIHNHTSHNITSHNHS